MPQPHTWVLTQLLTRAESDQTKGRLPPPPQHTEVKQPSGEPPRSWRNIPTTDWRPDINSAAQHTTANKTLPSQAGESMVEEKGGSRKRPCTQSTTPKHVERRPKKGSVSWKEPIEVTTIIRGDFQGIDRVERKLRRGTTAEHKATPEKMEINYATAPHLVIDPIAHKSQVRSDYDETFDTSNQQTNHGTETSQRAFPAELIKIIRDIRKEEIPVPTPPEFIFNMTEEAAEKNFLILKKYNFNLDKAILAQKSSPLGYGSEFRSQQTLGRIFQHHPLWSRMKNLLVKGSKWPLSTLSKSDRITDLTEALAFGNNKGASTKPVQIKKLISDDIRFGNIIDTSQTSTIGSWKTTQEFVTTLTIPRHGGMLVVMHHGVTNSQHLHSSIKTSSYAPTCEPTTSPNIIQLSNQEFATRAKRAMLDVES
jgi:hypothetical protein